MSAAFQAPGWTSTWPSMWMLGVPPRLTVLGTAAPGSWAAAARARDESPINARIVNDLCITPPEECGTRIAECGIELREARSPPPVCRPGPGPASCLLHQTQPIQRLTYDTSPPAPVCRDRPGRRARGLLPWPSTGLRARPRTRGPHQEDLDPGAPIRLSRAELRGLLRRVSGRRYEGAVRHGLRQGQPAEAARVLLGLRQLRGTCAR